MATNPIIPGFHPDPSLCRVGEDFYLVCSSFEYWPALPVFHSRDLVHWRQIANAADRAGQLDLTTVPSSLGITAPTIRHHDRRFWLACSILGASSPGARSGGLSSFQFILTAEDPAGPWSEPTPVPLPGIDPDLAWDDEGQCWFTYYGIRQARIDPDSGEVLSEAHPQWSGAPGAQSPEAPHLYRRGRYWYLMIAEGGTERGHAVSIARGPSPTGPFEPCPWNPILTHRGLAHDIQNTGHADLVELDDGSWWMVLLAVRPRGVTPRFHILGRETFLTSLRWEDDWPVVSRVEEDFAAPDLAPHPWPEEPSRHHFSDGLLGPQWLSVRQRPADQVGFDSGALVLTGSGDDLDGRLPVFVGRRQTDLFCKVACRVKRHSGTVGLAVRMDERHHAEVIADAERIRAVARVGDLRQEIGTAPLSEVSDGDSGIELAIETRPARGWGAGPDQVGLGYRRDGSFVALGELDGRYLSTEVAGGFTGRVIGVFVPTGTAYVDWFEYQAGGPR